MTGSSDSFDWASPRDLKFIDLLGATIDERSWIILVAAELDDRLGQLLEAALLPESNNFRDRLLDGPNSPMGSFSGRIVMCKALNLLPIECLNSIEQVRKIRNKAAHTQEFTLTDYQDLFKGATAFGRDSQAFEPLLASARQALANAGNSTLQDDVAFYVMALTIRRNIHAWATAGQPLTGLGPAHIHLI